MQLFLCEKPSQARDIARLLGATQKAEGCLRGPIAPISPRTTRRSPEDRRGDQAIRCEVRGPRRYLAQFAIAGWRIGHAWRSEFPVGHCCRHRPVTPRAPARDRRPDGLSVPVRAPPSRWPRSRATACTRGSWRNRARAPGSCNSFRRRARVSVNTCGCGDSSAA